LKNCYVKAREGSPDATLYYCSNNVIIWLLSTVNLVVFSLILLFHLRAKGFCTGANYLKVKTIILFLITFFQFMVSFRYFFELSDELSNFVLISTNFMQSVIFFLICFFFTKKAAFYLEESKKIK
jgi:hypothetical protein